MCSPISPEACVHQDPLSCLHHPDILYTGACNVCVHQDAPLVVCTILTVFSLVPVSVIYVFTKTPLVLYTIQTVFTVVTLPPYLPLSAGASPCPPAAPPPCPPAPAAGLPGRGGPYTGPLWPPLPCWGPANWPSAD